MSIEGLPFIILRSTSRHPWRIGISSVSGFGCLGSLLSCIFLACSLFPWSHLDFVVGCFRFWWCSWLFPSMRSLFPRLSSICWGVHRIFPCYSCFLSFFLWVVPQSCFLLFWLLLWGCCWTSLSNMLTCPGLVGGLLCFCWAWSSHSIL